MKHFNFRGQLSNILSAIALVISAIALTVGLYTTPLYVNGTEGGACGLP